jgi:hypothetical protein
MKFPSFTGIGTLGIVKDTGEGVFGQFEGIISVILGVLTVSAGLWFIFQLFGGALQWLSSGGEKQALQNAQKRIVNAIVGLFLVVFSYVLIALIGHIFGLNILSPWGALSGASAPGFPPGEYIPPCIPGRGCAR